MKAILRRALIPAFLLLMNSSAWAVGYWTCSTVIIVGQDCMLTVTYELWYNETTGDIIDEKTTHSCDCCGGIVGGTGKAFIAQRNPSTSGYEASNFTFTNTGTPELSQGQMIDIWNNHTRPWVETLDRNNPETCPE